MNVKGWMISLLVALVAVALSLLIAAGGEQRTARGQQDEATPGPSPAPAANAMAVDAKSGGGIDSARTVVGTAPFETDIVITGAPTPYVGYGYVLEWDSTVLTQDSEISIAPPELLVCRKAVRTSNTVWGNCGRGEGGTQFVGPVNTLTFHCIADGISPLRLSKGPNYTGMFDSSASPIDTSLADASVTCQNVGPSPPPPVPPVNDDFVNARAVTDLPFSEGQDIAGTTREPLERDACDMGPGTVWYSFAPATTQFIQADTFGSDFDTVLAVYTGGSLASLAPVVCNDDAEGLQSRVVVEMVAGVTYYFQVGGFSGYSGAMILNVEATPAPPPSTPNVMVVDAIPGNGADASRSVMGAGPFDVDIRITSAGQPYAAYEYKLRWDPQFLAYDAHANLNPVGLTLCAEPVVEGATVYGGCVRAHGETQFVGPLNTVTLRCIADGTSPLHLVAPTEDVAFGTKTVDSSAELLDQTLTDASITCQGTGRAGATPAAHTPVLALPATGTGGFLDGSEPP